MAEVKICKHIFNRGLKKGQECGKPCAEGKNVCSIHSKCKIKVPLTPDEIETKKQKMKQLRKKKSLIKSSGNLGVSPETFMESFKGATGFSDYVKPMKKNKESAKEFALHPLQHVVQNGSESEIRFVCDFLKAYKKVAK